MTASIPMEKKDRKEKKKTLTLCFGHKSISSKANTEHSSHVNLVSKISWHTVSFTVQVKERNIFYFKTIKTTKIAGTYINTPLGMQGRAV